MTYVTRRLFARSRLAAAREHYRFCSRQLAFVRRVWTHESTDYSLRCERDVMHALDELWLAQQEAERVLPQVRP